MNQHHHSRRITRTIVVVVAGVTVGLATTYAVASGSGSGPDHERVPSDQTEIAAWATERQLSGLSPASLASANERPPHPAVHMQALADYAREHGLSGLSPASLGPVDD